MLSPTITHHGAVTGVTGSCHQYSVENTSLLIDCGLFQGAESDRPLDEFDFDPAAIQTLIVTHGHIDHVGRIPWLIAAGFSGSIVCSEPTAKLLPIIMRDALEINIRDDQAVVEATVQRLESQLVALPYGEWHSLGNALQVRLQNAGHILGSAYVELDYRSGSEKDKSHRTVFSGDLGSPGAVFVEPVISPERADTLIIETTYGDRVHSHRAEREALLATLVNKALADNGTLLIPAFSLGRTQELLSMLENLFHTGAIKPKGKHPIPVILDSPLAQEITVAYRALSRYWPEQLIDRKSENRLPLAFDTLITVNDHREHLKLVKRLAQTEQPAIVIAASGMCQGGRIVNYLDALLSKTTTDVLFVGYQARGTKGAEIQQQAKAGKLKAQVHTVSGFSAHADQSDLLAFIEGIAEKPGEIRLVHGDDRAKKVFRGKLAGYDVVVPE